MISRQHYLHEIVEAFEVHPIVAILGPRQCGKTTLAKDYLRLYSEKHGAVPARNYFDLENPRDLNRLQNPMGALEALTGLIIIDEIQRSPELFPLLRVLVDNFSGVQQYLILGSASQDLLKQSSESLAGRLEYISLPPFSLSEVDDLESLWFRGGFPKSYLAQTEAGSLRWRNSYIKTFLENDLPKLGITIHSMDLYRFWMMLAHYHGGVINYSELGRSLQISQKTASYYCEILTKTFMIRQLQPWFENIGKRQIKSHKIYFRDSGIYHALLQIKSKDDLAHHIKLGASWEGFALEEVIRHYHIREEEAYFWSTQGDAELDLLIFRHGKRLGFEFKFSSTPKVTKSMHSALEDLKLDALYIICQGDKSYPLTESIFAIGLDNLTEDLP